MSVFTAVHHFPASPPVPVAQWSFSLFTATGSTEFTFRKADLWGLLWFLEHKEADILGRKRKNH